MQKSPKKKNEEKASIDKATKPNLSEKKKRTWMRLTTRPEMKKRRPNGTMTAAAAIAMEVLEIRREGWVWREKLELFVKREDYSKFFILETKNNGLK